MTNFMIVDPYLTRRKTLLLHTRRGNRIENEQSSEISLFERKTFEDTLRRYPMAIPRTDCIPFYNCHGMTLASRRTWIFETATIRKILDDDGYSEVLTGNALPGDLAVYYEPNGEISHTGIVIREKGPSDFFPTLVSKWGGGAEVIHVANNCPYDPSNIRYYRPTS